LSDKHYFPDGDIHWWAHDAMSFWGNSCEAVWLEHRAAWLLAKQERNGFPFNTKAIEELYVELAGRRSELLQTLTDTFGTWYQPKG
ncbi:hypothetical protein, partial [Escherichia coli]|uniref:hypothetical protein n=1 Tax=Escherichia coli TaxID=562 RepID=UPI001F3D268E